MRLAIQAHKLYALFHIASQPPCPKIPQLRGPVPMLHCMHGVYDRRRIVQLSHSAVGGMKNIHIEKNTHFKNIRANENSERGEEV